MPFRNGSVSSDRQYPAADASVSAAADQSIVARQNAGSLRANFATQPQFFARGYFQPDEFVQVFRLSCEIDTAVDDERRSAASVHSSFPQFALDPRHAVPAGRLEGNVVSIRASLVLPVDAFSRSDCQQRYRNI